MSNEKKEIVKVVTKNKKSPQKALTEFLSVFTRHPTQKQLRGKIRVDQPTSIRFGSTTRSINGKRYVIELNLPEAVLTSSDKYRMKWAFKQNNIKTANWIECPIGLTQQIEQVGNGKIKNVEYLVQTDGTEIINKLKFPIVCKHRFGSRNTGNTLFKTYQEFDVWRSRKTEDQLTNYIVEQYMNYSREYRVHCTPQGAFYYCRKALKEQTSEENKWFRNDSNSVWFVEENENFLRPSNWEEILSHCVLALNAVGLDVGAIDLRVQAEKEGVSPDYFILETNSAPSFGDITLKKYLEELPKLIEFKKKQ